MANLTASGVIPQVTWEDTNDLDFRMRAVNDAALQLQGEAPVGSPPLWQEHFAWRDAEHSSRRDLRIEQDPVTVELYDRGASPAAYLYRLRNEDKNLFVEVDKTGSGGFYGSFRSNGVQAFAGKGFAAGHDASTGTSYTIGVKYRSGYLDASGVTAIDLYDPNHSPYDVVGDTLGVLVMVTTDDTASPPVYTAYDARDVTTGGFYVQVVRGASGASPPGDQVVITADTGVYSPSNVAKYYIVAFYKRTS